VEVCRGAYREEEDQEEGLEVEEGGLVGGSAACHICDRSVFTIVAIREKDAAVSFF
jgi:hypothetical protein